MSFLQKRSSSPFLLMDDDVGRKKFHLDLATLRHSEESDEVGRVLHNLASLLAVYIQGRGLFGLVPK